MRRLSILSGLAALALLASPAMAGGSKSGGYTDCPTSCGGGVPVHSGYPMFNQNLGHASANAIGVHNKVKQDIFAQQTNVGGHGKKYGGKHDGKPGYPWPGTAFNSNAGSIDANAIGVGNKVKQDVTAIQTGTPHAMFNSNLGSVQANAIGMFNRTEQRITGIQE